MLAMVTRILLLFTITAVMGLTAPFFSILGHAVSGRDLILLAGGLFLIAKATFEIHEKLEGAREKEIAIKAASTYASVIVQIAILDIVFSLDSVITAVGMARSVPVMVLAIVAAVGVMLIFSGSICAFIERHPTFKVLALSFLLLIGVVLVADGVGQHINKGYVYVAMAFSLFVEILNVKMIARRTAAEANAE
jgi:predicted tellurium resistance membrane protein TerC